MYLKKMICKIVTKVIEKKHQFLYFLWLYKLKLNEFLSKDDNGRSAIVMFHHVRDDEAVEILDSCKCTTKEFVEFCNLVSNNSRVVSLRELITNIEQKSGNNMIVISFDDVPQNFYTTAYPILKSYRFPFILYITTGFLDKEDYLSFEQVRELSKDPLCTIGCHTFSHPFLKHSTDLEREIITCKNELEQLLDLTIKDFAYPYGTPTAINKDVIRYVSETNRYETGVITVPGFINSLSIKNRFALPRIHSKLFMKKYC